MPTTLEGNRDSDLTRNHVDTYLDMEKLLVTGKVKAIGVANYSVKYLDKLLPRATIVPAVNQIENHPLLPQHDVSDYCKKNGILITAYSPLGSSGSPLLKMPVVERIAAKHGLFCQVRGLNTLTELLSVVWTDLYTNTTAVSIPPTLLTYHVQGAHDSLLT